MRLVTVLLIAWFFENTDTEENMNINEERIIASGKYIEDNAPILNRTEDFLETTVETKSVSVEIMPSKETILQRRSVDLGNEKLCACTFPSCPCSRLIRVSVTQLVKREVRSVKVHLTSTTTSFPEKPTGRSYSGGSLGNFKKHPRSVDVFLRNYPFDNDNGFEQSEFSDENGPVYGDLTLTVADSLSDNVELIPYQFQNQVSLRTENSPEVLPFKSFSSSGVTSEKSETPDGKHRSVDSPARLESSIAKNLSGSVTRLKKSNKNESKPIKSEFNEFRSAKSNFIEPLTVKVFTNETKSNGSDVYALFISRHPVDDWKALGYFTEDYLHVISKHWLQFPPASHSSHYVLAVLYALIMSVGVTGNFLVIFMFLR